MCRKQTGTDLRLLEAMSSAGSKLRSLGCQGNCITLCITSPCVFTSVDVLYCAFSDRTPQSQVNVLEVRAFKNVIAI